LKRKRKRRRYYVSIVGGRSLNGGKIPTRIGAAAPLTRVVGRKPEMDCCISNYLLVI
jgi:hypothetical protein